jgi:hypothetical protein
MQLFFIFVELTRKLNLLCAIRFCYAVKIVECAIVHIYSFLCRERFGMHANGHTQPESCLGYSPTPFHIIGYSSTQYNVEQYP